MLSLKPVEKKSGLTPETFKKEHLDPMVPVVFKDLMDGWSGKTRWTVPFFKENYGYKGMPDEKNIDSKRKRFTLKEYEIIFRKLKKI